MIFKQVVTLALTLAVFISAVDALAMNKPNTSRMPASEKCTLKTTDMGPIQGQGNDTEAAFSDAVLKCVKRREAIFDARHAQNIRGLSSDDANERGELDIDICVNLSCS